MWTFASYWNEILFVLIVLAVALVIGRSLRFLMGRFVRASSSKLKVDPTKYNFLKNAAEFIIYIIGIIVIFNSIPSLKSYGTALFAGAGVLAAIVGFASQSAFSNIISGVFIVMFRPFSVGDRIKVGSSYTGDVLDITLRHTIIKDFENRRIVIPNSVINNETIINSTLSDEYICIFVELFVALDSNLTRAMDIMREEVQHHPEFRDCRTQTDKDANVHPVETRVLEITDTGIKLRSWAWAEDPTVGFVMKCDLLESIRNRFVQENIQLAIPYRIISIKGTTTAVN